MIVKRRKSMEKSFGTFMKEKRLEKNLTQKELAKILYVTESAVSKWEKDVAHPDISLLPKLAEILGVSEHELITASIDNKSREEKVQAKKWRAFSMSWSLFFYIAYAIALIPCFICNLAIDKTLSWFWIVFSALLLAFTFTNLPKLVKKHKLILLPLSMFLALCLLLGICCIYTKGDWFWIPVLSVLFGMILIFTPIYLSKYKVFENIKRYKDFVSIGIDYLVLNLLLIVIDFYSVGNNYTANHWYLNIALPITTIFYLILNILFCVKFLKTNKFLKTSIVLLLIDIFLYIPPMFIKLKDKNLQEELIDDVNILKSNLAVWKTEATQDNNIHCIIALTLVCLAVIFAIIGLILHLKRKKQNKI